MPVRPFHPRPRLARLRMLAVSAALAAATLSFPGAAQEAARPESEAEEQDAQPDRDAQREPSDRPAEAQPNTTQQREARNLIWDRARLRTDLARRKADLDLELLELKRTLGDEHPRVEQVRQRAVAVARQMEQQERAAAGGPPMVLEKAAYLGVATSPATPVLQKHLKLLDGVGLVVDFIEPGSPAEAGGLKPYDVLVRVQEQILINPQQLAVLLRTFDPGVAVQFRIVREGEPATVEVRLVEREVKPIGWVNFGAYGVPGGVPGGEEGDVRVDALRGVVPIVPVGDDDSDYVIRPGDLLTVRIHDLQGPGLDTTKAARAAPDGTVRLPFLDKPIRAAGRTQTDLQQAIVRGYRTAGVLDNASVSVWVGRAAADAPAGQNAPPRPQPVPPAPRPAADPQPVETSGPDE